MIVKLTTTMMMITDSVYSTAVMPGAANGVPPSMHNYGYAQLLQQPFRFKSDHEPTYYSPYAPMPRATGGHHHHKARPAKRISTSAFIWI